MQFFVNRKYVNYPLIKNERYNVVQGLQFVCYFLNKQILDVESFKVILDREHEKIQQQSTFHCF